MPDTIIRVARTTARAAFAVFALALTASGAQAEGSSMSPSVVAVPGKPALLLSAFDLAAVGLSTEEFFISGNASSYKLAAPPSEDGHWSATPAQSAPYVTRIVVVKPTDAKKFNGTVVVEWLNVSAGADGSPDWNATHRELIRGGYAYVAVSAQKVGVEGGASATPTAGAIPLKKADPARYGSLNHPGDAYSYDIFSQAGRLLRSADAAKVLGGLAPKHVIAVGESQSAVFLTTYLNAVDPLAKVYDGFLIHSRFGSSSSLEDTGMLGQGQPKVARFRSDLRAPVITVITETDLLDGRLPGYHAARVPDSNHLRVWEVPGTSHADSYTFGVGFIDSGSTPLEKLAAGFEPTNKILGSELAKAINNGPQHHYVVEAALWNLERWVRTGQAPAKAAPMKLHDDQTPATLVLDANGLAESGVRTPWVDVPTSRLSGGGNSGSPLAFLAGSCEPFDAATLDRLYPGGKGEYLKKFEQSLSSAIKSNFILPADREEIMGLAGIAYKGSH